MLRIRATLSKEAVHLPCRSNCAETSATFGLNNKTFLLVTFVVVVLPMFLGRAMYMSSLSWGTLGQPRRGSPEGGGEVSGPNIT